MTEGLLCRCADESILATNKTVDVWASGELMSAGENASTLVICRVRRHIPESFGRTSPLDVP
jgi:hypothetical protein